MKNLYIYILFFICSIAYPSNVGNGLLSNQSYITGEDGVIRMYVNIMGHVKNPGTYLVYDKIDILTCLSMAGGPLKGANLAKVIITSEDGSSSEIDLASMLGNDNIRPIELKPRDTIYIDETLSNFIFSRSNVIPILLQITVLIVNINK